MVYEFLDFRIVVSNIPVKLLHDGHIVSVDFNITS